MALLSSQLAGITFDSLMVILQESTDSQLQTTMLEFKSNVNKVYLFCKYGDIIKKDHFKCLIISN